MFVFDDNRRTVFVTPSFSHRKGPGTDKGPLFQIAAVGHAAPFNVFSALSPGSLEMTRSLLLTTAEQSVSITGHLLLPDSFQRTRDSPVLPLTAQRKRNKICRDYGGAGRVKELRGIRKHFNSDSIHCPHPHKRRSSH